MQLKYRVACLSSMLLYFIIGCGGIAPFGPEDTQDTAITASLNFSHGRILSLALTRILLQVSGKGIDTIEQELSLEGSTARGQVKVPKNKDLIFTVTAYNETMAVLSGSQPFNTKDGKTVQINLDFLVAALILSPPTVTVKKDDTVTFSLSARKVLDLGVVGARVQFDAARLQVVDLQREDDFLTSQSGAVNQLVFTKDNTKGTVSLVIGIVPAAAAVSGEGTIAKIVFKTLQTGTTDVELSLDAEVDSDLGFYDKNADPLYAIGLGSRITVN